MEALFAALSATEWAVALRGSRWLYAGVNASHILGIALLVGAILPMDIRLLGGWAGVPREVLARVLVPTAAVGLALALATGFLLFSIRASEYAANTIVWAKLALVTTGSLSAITLHLVHGWWFRDAGAALLKRAALVSLTSWLGALILGRLIAFTGN